MKLLSGILGLTLTSAVALASANAADLYRGPAGGGYKDGPYVPVASWTGFYVGVNGGYGWSNGGTVDVDYAGAFNPVKLAGIDLSGGFGGGQIGYNYSGIGSRFVIGVEVDIQGSGLTDSYSSVGTVYNQRHDIKQDVDYFGTVRGRLGYAVDHTLVYATGGFAYGNVNTRIGAYLNPPGAAPYTVYKSDGVETGYAVGGGVEHKFTPAWSLKAEYQYIDLGKQTIHGDVAFPTYNVKDLETNFHTVRVGLNYHVLPGYEPLK
jgi:outer membrane immunogenic protein